ncbi:type II toxin-antitoxin system PemK/MazF family toxin [Marinoscillum furvescens]|uniref:mRNA interferase n=1 Tax=Marinoscillum furvescens DSM 4134 TaxID=1122208 RepID=A0A3D9L7X0_MARFU|nr:type II toxin-antitoxin system PemK/MazF family toxin [Marinoscillum furvescens]REE00577.1 mRNA interferase MazF [Marinoscillum furvescens DSM 4134]
MRFEIWLANLNPHRGTEVGKVRPVLIIQTDLLGDSLESTIICPLTTRQSNSKITKIHVPPCDETGLENDSWIVIDQIRAINNRRLISKLGQLPEEIGDQVNYSLKIILDLI